LFCLSPLKIGSDGLVQYEVNRNSKVFMVSALEVIAALIGHLKRLVETHLGDSWGNVVFSMPASYGETHRQALKDAAEIAGFEAQQVYTINENTAIALDYAHNKSKTWDEQSRCIGFVNMGHAITTVSIVEFEKHQTKLSKLRVLAECCNNNLGGRNIDDLLSKYFSAKFKSNGMNPDATLKKQLKLEKAATKCKIVLSGGQETMFNVDAYFEGDDAEGKISIEEYESLCSPLQQELRDVIQKAIAESGKPKNSIRSVEVVGGCSPIPWVLRCIGEEFGKEPRRTLLLDETAVRGCTLYATMMNPQPFFYVDITERNSPKTATYIPTSKKEIFKKAEKEMAGADKLLWHKREMKNKLEKRVYTLKKEVKTMSLGSQAESALNKVLKEGETWVCSQNDHVGIDELENKAKTLEAAVARSRVYDDVVKIVSKFKSETQRIESETMQTAESSARHKMLEECYLWRDWLDTTSVLNEAEPLAGTVSVSAIGDKLAEFYGTYEAFKKTPVPAPTPVSLPQAQTVEEKMEPPKPTFSIAEKVEKEITTPTKEKESKFWKGGMCCGGKKDVRDPK